MPARYCRPRSLSWCSTVGATSMPSLPPAALMKAVADRRLRHVELNRHVAAGDVEADAAHRDVLVIGDHAADRLGIAEVAVGAQHAAHDAAVLHTARHLLLGALVMRPENLHLRHG